MCNCYPHGVLVFGTSASGGRERSNRSADICGGGIGKRLQRSGLVRKK